MVGSFFELFLQLMLSLYLGIESRRILVEAVPQRCHECGLHLWIFFIPAIAGLTIVCVAGVIGVSGGWRDCPISIWCGCGSGWWNSGVGLAVGDVGVGAGIGGSVVVVLPYFVPDLGLLGWVVGVRDDSGADYPTADHIPIWYRCSCWGARCGIWCGSIARITGVGGAWYWCIRIRCVCWRRVCVCGLRGGCLAADIRICVGICVRLRLCARYDASVCANDIGLPLLSLGDVWRRWGGLRYWWWVADWLWIWGWRWRWCIAGCRVCYWRAWISIIHIGLIISIPVIPHRIGGILAIDVAVLSISTVRSIRVGRWALWWIIGGTLAIAIMVEVISIHYWLITFLARLRPGLALHTMILIFVSWYRKLAVDACHGLG